MSRTLGRPTESRSPESTVVANASKTSAVIHAASCRRPETPTARRRRGGERSTAPSGPGSCEITCTSIDPEWRTTRLHDRATVQQLLPPRTGTRADDQLGAVLRAREVGERLRDVRTDDLVVLPAEVLEELAMGLDRGRPSSEALAAAHVDTEQLTVRRVARRARHGG